MNIQTKISAFAACALLACFVCDDGLSQTQTMQLSLSESDKLHFTLSKSYKAPELTSLLGQIADQRNLGFSYEQIMPESVEFGRLTSVSTFRLYTQKRIFPQGLTLTPGSYDLAQLELAIEKQAPLLKGSKWREDKRWVNVTLNGDSSLPNPLDSKVLATTRFQVTPRQFVQWLQRQTPEVQVGFPLMDNFGASSSQKQTVVLVAQGMTLRQVINQFSEKAGYTWRADIYHQKSWTSSYKDLDSGKTVERVAPATVAVDLEFAPVNTFS